MKAAEIAEVMAQFSAGRLNVLVATTVIEVGVDVPNAAQMVIEHAKRMGLAQLHQLRGRVGRGAAESVCVLLFAEPLSELAIARLKVIYEHTDGFEFARQDLNIRGPAVFLGVGVKAACLCCTFRQARRRLYTFWNKRAKSPRYLLSKTPKSSKRIWQDGFPSEVVFGRV